MMRHISLSLLCVMPLAHAAALSLTAITPPATTPVAQPSVTYMARLTPDVIVCPRDISDVTLFHAKDSFFASRDNCKTVTQVNNYTVDEQLQGLSHEQLAALLQDSRIKLSQNSDGQFRLELMPLLRGGLATGAWLGGAVGFWGTQLVFNGFYAAVGFGATALTGPIIGGTIALTVRGALTPLQLATTKVMTITCGLAGAVASGPV